MVTSDLFGGLFPYHKTNTSSGVFKLAPQEAFRLNRIPYQPSPLPPRTTFMGNYQQICQLLNNL